jgi:regulatory protein
VNTGGPASLRQRALAYLATREHSRAELARKLATARRSAGPTEARTEADALARLTAIEQLLDELQAQGLLSNTRYVASVLHRRAPRLGSARIRQELRAKGVPEDTLRDGLAGLAESEEARAREVWQRRFGHLPAAGDAKECARQGRFLLARGFAGEIVQRILRGSGSGTADPDEDTNVPPT